MLVEDDCHVLLKVQIGHSKSEKLREAGSGVDKGKIGAVSRRSVPLAQGEQCSQLLVGQYRDGAVPGRAAASSGRTD